MKQFKFTALLLTATFAFALYFVACQKEAVVTEITDTPVATQVNTESEITDRGPLILGTVSVECACSERACNVVGPVTTGYKFNGIKIVLDPITHSYYNSRNGLTYTIRQGGSCSGPVVASFNCRNATVRYSNAALLDNTLYTVVITDGPSSSPCYAFTTSNCRTQICGAE